MRHSSSDSGSRPEPRRAWLHPRVLSAAGLALTAGFAQFAVTAVLGDVAADFGEAHPEAGIAAEVGMTGTALGIGLAIIRLAAIGSLPMASLADRLGRRRMVMACCAGGLAITALAAFAPGWWWLVIVLAFARPLLAATNAVAGVIAAEETTSADRSKAIALVGGSYAIGTGLVAVVRSALEDVVGFRWIFALAVVPLLVLPWISRHVHDSSLYREAAQRTTPRKRLGVVRQDLRGRLVIVCALHVAAGVITGPVYTYLFVYGERVVGAESSEMAALVVAAGPAGLAGLLLGRWLADRLGRRVSAGGAMVVAAAAATAAYSGGFPALAVGYLLTIFAGAAYTPAAGALDAEIFPTSARATAAGWISASQILGAVIGLAVFGVLADVMDGFAPAAVVLWLPMALVALLYIRLPETKGLELSESAPERR